MSSESKAVFLSYASQDSDAVKKICDALRAAGVEVWFDQSELVGGDAWDAKIRKQIKDCALFVPVISANTQARHEGYFRLEWRLADQRTHLMGKSKAFLLPVCIDETRDTEADVPDSFLAVQWTRLRPLGYDGQAPDEAPVAALCERVRKLLTGEVAPVSRLRPLGYDEAELEGRAEALAKAADRRSEVSQTTDAGRPPPEAMARQGRPAVLRRWLIPGIAALAAILALALWQPWKKSLVAPGQSVAPAPAASASKSGAETAADLADQARSHYYPFSTPASLQLADELGRRATELDPQYARGWGTRASASARYLLRSFVSGDAAAQRARDAQSFANRALSLDKNETEALVALGIVAVRQHAPTQAETIFRRVLAVDPNNVQAPSLLSMVLRETGRDAEALALMKRAVANAPRDPIVHLFLGFVYWAGWNFTKAAEQFDTAATVADFQGARVYQAWMVFLQTGDLARLRAMLESVDLIYSAEDGKLGYLLACGLYERRADRVLEAVGRTSSAYFDGGAMPKAWFSALAYEMDHKDNLARQQWLAGEAVIRERLRVDPQSEMLRMNLAITLAKLGRPTEARAEFDAVDGAWREQLNARHALWLARFHAVVGDAPRAVALLRQGMNHLEGDSEEGHQVATRRTLELDPWWDPIRNTTEFRELLAHPPEPPKPVDEPGTDGLNAAAPAAKSVAVLAFANLSDDKDNEYFSDGISEELLNVLAKVPGLKVSARTSAFSFKGKGVAIPEIARQLGVAYVLEGSVRKAGSRVRITAQLIKASDGFHVWSDNFDRELKDIFAVQDEIAGVIARNLQLTLAAGGSTPKAVNPEAFELYVRARAAWNLRTMAGFDQAETLLQRALALEPNLARAHAALADVWSNRGQDTGQVGPFGMRDGSEVARVLAQARKAVEVDANSAEAHASLGAMLWIAAWRPEDGEIELRRAIQLNPNYASAHQWLGRTLAIQGKIDEALAALRQATELDPLSARILDNYAAVLSAVDRHEAALDLGNRALVVQPNLPGVRGQKARDLLALNRRDEAGALVREREQFLNHEMNRLLVLAGLDRAAEAESGLKEAGASFPDPWRVLLALGRREDALQALDPTKAYSYMVEAWLYAPEIDSIRDDPRFIRFVATLGLTAAHGRARAWRAANQATEMQKTEGGGQRADKKGSAK